jgi:hypothetical protein
LWDRAFVDRNATAKTKITSTDPVFPMELLSMNGTYVSHESVGRFLSDRDIEARKSVGGIGDAAIIDTTKVLPRDQFDYLVAAIAEDALHAYAQGRDPGFYSQDLSDAMSKMSTRHPELETDANAKFVFTMLTAITSNGQDPTLNLADSDALYDLFKKSGTCVPDGAVGGARDAKGSLKTFQSMLDSFGIERTRNLLSGYTTAERVNQTLQKLSEKSKDPEWQARTKGRPWLTTEFEKKKGPSIDTDKGGEFADEVVPVASIFGPKIGSFFANLSGRHDFLTMDRWLMRSAGRITGELLTRSTPAGGSDRATNALAALAVPKWSSKLMFGIDKKFGITKQDLIRSLTIQQKTGVIEENGAAYLWAIAAERSHKNTKKANGGQYGTHPDPEMHEAHTSGNSIFKSLVHEQQDPRGSQARRSLREVFREVVKRIEEEYPERKGKVDVDEVQAVLWQYEKNLWKHLGAKVQIDENSLYSKAADDLIAGRTKVRDFKAEKRSETEGLGGMENDDVYQHDAEQDFWSAEIEESGVDLLEVFKALEEVVAESRSADCGREDDGRFGPKNDCQDDDGGSSQSTAQSGGSRPDEYPELDSLKVPPAPDVVAESMTDNKEWTAKDLKSSPPFDGAERLESIRITDKGSEIQSRLEGMGIGLGEAIGLAGAVRDGNNVSIRRDYETPSSEGLFIDSYRSLGGVDYGIEQTTVIKNVGPKGKSEIQIDHKIVQVAEAIKADPAKRVSAAREFYRTMADSVEAARKVGATRITLNAAGSSGGKSGYRGYTIWPRMGFDAPIPFNLRQKLPESLSASNTLLDLHTSREGRDWWEANGRDIDVTLDLRDRSSPQNKVIDKFLKRFSGESRSESEKVKTDASGWLAMEDHAKFEEIWEEIIEEGVFDDYGES